MTVAAEWATIKPKKLAQYARSCLVHLARQAPTDHGLCHAPGFDQLVEIDAGLDAHAVQHVDEIFGGQVAGGTRSVGAAAQASDCGIEIANAELQPHERVGERRAASVMKMQR